MESIDRKYLNKSGIIRKRRSTLLKYYNRKCDDITEKTSFKDKHGDIFSESTAGNFHGYMTYFLWLRL